MHRTYKRRHTNIKYFYKHLAIEMISQFDFSFFKEMKKNTISMVRRKKNKFMILDCVGILFEIIWLF